VRALFEASLPRDSATYNEFHGLIVHVGKNWCHTQNPRCEVCPLQPYLPSEQRARSTAEVNAGGMPTGPNAGRMPALQNASLETLP